MAGKPPKYKTTEELQSAIDAYFEACGENGEPYTVTGLALALGFSDRQSLYDQEDRGDEYSCIVKRARLRVEQGYELALFGKSYGGAIFALKNMGWKDKTEVDNKTTIVGKPAIKLDFGAIGEDYKGD